MSGYFDPCYKNLKINKKKKELVCFAFAVSFLFAICIMTILNSSTIYSVSSIDHLLCFRGFVNLKKIKKSEKNRKWAGGSSPNSDFFFLEILCFSVLFVLFSCFQLFQKKKKLDSGVGGLQDISHHRRSPPPPKTFRPHLQDVSPPSPWRLVPV